MYSGTFFMPIIFTPLCLFVPISRLLHEQGHLSLDDPVSNYLDTRLLPF
jgi:hypothetical protein